MSEKSMSKDTRKNVILLHIAVMCFSCSGVIGQYVQVPAVQVAMGRVICSSLLLLAISLVCKDKLTLDSKKDYGLMILTGVVMAIHWSSFFQSIQTSSVAIGTITFSTFPLFLTFLEPLLFHEKIRGKNILNALILLMGVLITIPEFSVENKVTSGILWGMLASFTYAVMTLSNRYFSSRYKGRTICLYEQGTAAIALLPALVLVKAEWRPVDFAGVATIGFLVITLPSDFAPHTQYLYVTAQKGVKAQTAGIISGMETVYGIVFALIFLREIPTVRELVGGAVILGIAFYSSLHSED